jgi:hypothetical protein
MLSTLMALPGLAQETRNPDIEATINNQFQAFIAEDVDKAFTYASPNIKGIFGTPENFAAMVRQGYPMVWKPSAVKMLELRNVSGSLWQRVLVTDQSGRSFTLDYQMIETSDGWQINGVQLLPNTSVGA